MALSPSKVLLLSCYELGRKPLGLATPLAFLKRRGHAARAIDLAVSPLEEEWVRESEFIGVSVPMHTALRIGLELLPRLRKLNPSAHICYYGLYAALNRELLLANGADSVLAGECEEALAERAGAYAASPGTHEPLRVKLDFPVPSRREIPSSKGYVHFVRGDGRHVPAGTVESTRGCLHRCRHCPIPPVYEGRFFVVPRQTVLSDIRQLVEDGAQHIDFADPDFLNGPGHALELVREMRAEFGDLTFDFTAKVEHLLKHRKHLDELAELGCAFIVTAVESLSDTVLTALEKGHDRQDVFEVLAAARNAGIPLRPTFVAFTPWTTRADYEELLRFIAAEGLVPNVDSVQLGLRLLVPPGSLLLGSECFEPFQGELDAEALTYRWTHPDPSMDRLQQEVMALVEAGLRAGRAASELFAEVADLAGVALLPPKPRPSPGPRLTEAWFC